MSETYLVTPPRDNDRGGVWRLGGFSIGVLLGAAALTQAGLDRRLRRRQRLVAGAVAMVYTVAGAYVVANPSWLARRVLRHPRRTLLTAFVPLAAAPLTGGGRSPMHTLAAAAAGGSAVIYGRRTGARVAGVAGGVWRLQASIATDRSAPGPAWSWVHIVLPLTYAITARVASTLASFAYNARSLDSTLRDLSAEHDGLREFAAELDSELHAAAAPLVSLLGDRADRQRADQVLSALGRLHEARAVLRATLRREAPARPKLPADYLRRALIRRGTREAELPVPVRRRRLMDICDEQIRELEHMLPAGVTIHMAVDPAVTLGGSDRIAVAAAAVTAGIVNAVRHTERLTTIQITTEMASYPTDVDDAVEAVDVVEMRIDNDGVVAADAAPVRPGIGLRTLAREVGRLAGGHGGRVDTARLEPGRFRLLIRLPLGPRETEVGQLLAWDQIEAKLDAALREATNVCAVMVGASLLEKPSHSFARAAASALATTSVPIGYMLGELVGHPYDRRAHWPLVAAAAVSATSPGPQRGILCGWSNAALARHALHHAPLETGSLLALNAAGIATAYRNGVDKSPLAGQLATLVAGVVGMLVISLPAIDGLRRRERDVIGTLGAIESADRIALQFHGVHSCVEPMKQLVARADVGDGPRAALRGSIKRIDDISAPRAGDFENMLGALVGEVCTVIGRRVWPAPISVDVDMRWLRDQEVGDLHRMRLRRAAIAVADVVAREAVSHAPVGLDGTRPVDHVYVRVGGVAGSTSVQFAVRPVAYPSAEGDARLGERLAALNAALVRWTDDGELTFALYPRL